MSTAPRPLDDALGLAALQLLPEEGATARSLAAGFGEDGIGLDADRAGDLLARLAELGLARVATLEAGEARYVATSLGQRSAQSGLGGDPRLAVGLQELERLRTDLLSTIAHELRTPLTSLRTSVGLLLDPTVRPTDDERQRLLTTIARSSDRMQRLLEDLLDLARFRAGRVVLQLRRFDARRVARDVAAAIGPLAAAAEQTIRLDLPSRPVPVAADHRRIEQALLNLVSNAQKFSPPGGEVEITVASDEATVRWTVTDRGPGIAAEDQARLFERFFVGTSDRSGPGGGIGLGLPTALAIAQAHGGSIEVDSATGRGSVFSLVVPAPPDDAERDEEIGQ